MLTSMKQGWKTTGHAALIMILLFCYQWVWGLCLFKLIKGILLPLLHRYPDPALGWQAIHLFWAEGQFQLLKTDLINPLIWLLGLLLAIRMVITPFINAALYYTLKNPNMGRLRCLLHGIKHFGRKFAIIYAVQMAITCTPLLWFIPKLKSVFHAAVSYDILFATFAPPLIGWVVFAALLDLCCMYILFGMMESYKLRQSLARWMRSLLPSIGIALSIFCIACAVSLSVTALSMIWAGFAAIVIHQLYRFLNTAFKIWAIAAQYHVWTGKRAE